ncbi:MAG: NUDIX domain-containing protein, partial [Anaerolineae bacterium]
MASAAYPSAPDGSALEGQRLRYAAAGGVVVDGGRVLLLDRPSRGEVRLPKGHIEPDESSADAALRETAEESGYGDLRIEADLGNQLVSFEYEGQRYLRDER